VPDSEVRSLRGTLVSTFGIKCTLAIYDSRAVFGFEVPKQTRGYKDRNFQITALLRCRLSRTVSVSALVQPHSLLGLNDWHASMADVRFASCNSSKSPPRSAAEGRGVTRPPSTERSEWSVPCLQLPAATPSTPPSCGELSLLGAPPSAA